MLCEAHALQLTKVVLCTAMPFHLPDSLGRHRTFNNAQIACGVEVIEGHYIFSDDIKGYTEKQSDINVALSLITDGIDNIYDWAILVSADSDQAATARVFRERFSDKNLAVIAPPNRKPPEKAIPYCDLHFSISKDQIEDALLPEYVKSLSGGFIRRPKEYDPPAGWLAPSHRPKRKRSAKPS